MRWGAAGGKRRHLSFLSPKPVLFKIGTSQQRGRETQKTQSTAGQTESESKGEYGCRGRWRVGRGCEQRAC